MCYNIDQCQYPLYSSFDKGETASHEESERQFKKASSYNYCGSTQQPSLLGLVR